MGKTAYQKKMGLRGRIQNFRGYMNAMKAMKTAPRRRKGVFYSRQKKANSQPLRYLEVPSYVDLVKWSETKCKTILQKSYVLPSKQELQKMRCRACKSRFRLSMPYSTHMSMRKLYASSRCAIQRTKQNTCFWDAEGKRAGRRLIKPRWHSRHFGLPQLLADPWQVKVWLDLFMAMAWNYLKMQRCIWQVSQGN